MKITKTAVLFMSALILSGCASTPSGSTKVSAPVESAKIIAWKNSKSLSEIPLWVKDSFSGNISALETGELSENLAGKYFIVVEGSLNKTAETEKDLRLLETSVTAQYNVQLAKNINAELDRLSSGKLFSNQETKELLTGKAAQAVFEGFESVADFWILQENPNKNAKTLYRAVQIFACEKELWLKEAEAYIKLVSMESNKELKKAASSPEETARSIKPVKTDIYY